jgi:hypothetical protein
MKIKIYSGLTLSEQEIRAVLPQAHCAPPIRRFDLAQDVEQGFHVVGIIDGEFFQSFAVTPSEILDALRSGLRVYGAGSMGAMRAAELRVHGMVGCGAIYDRICRERYFQDDHLGVVFDGIEGQASLPMVDFIATVDHLVDGTLLPKESASVLIQAYQRLHFTQRRIDALRASLASAGVLDGALAQAVTDLERRTVSLKRLDGLELLARVADDLSEVRRLNAFFHSSHNTPTRHANTSSSLSDV